MAIPQRLSQIAILPTRDPDLREVILEHHHLQNELQAHSSDAKSVAWTPDGKCLLSAGMDGIIQVYAMDIDLLLTLARRLVTRNLTLDKCRKYLHRNDIPPIP